MNSEISSVEPTKNSSSQFFADISNKKEHEFTFESGPLSGIIIGCIVILVLFFCVLYYYIIPSLGIQSMASNSVAPIVIEKGVMI